MFFIFRETKVLTIYVHQYPQPIIATLVFLEYIFYIYMKILCIIPIFNEEARLKNLMEEIVVFKEKTNLNIEFLLINNGSTDSTENILSKYNFKYINIKK